MRLRECCSDRCHEQIIFLVCFPRRTLFTGGQKTHANLLREIQRCYLKLISALDVPIDSQDQKEILFVSNALVLAEKLHDQSLSLMALQFSIAAYELEGHLRYAYNFHDILCITGVDHIVASLWGDVAEAFPFGKASGVVELTPTTFNSFVSSHKPVYVLFYAPWCGHCRKIHPEWEKFAQSVQGTIRVGALNADEHSQLGSQFGIRGFPTIKYWNVGDKNINKALEYDGPRQASSIQAKAMSLITSSRVKTMLYPDALREAARSAVEKKVAVLFSSKTRVPAIFSVLSYSPRLNSMPFYFVGGQAKAGFAKEFGVEDLPSIVVLDATESDIKTVMFSGKQIAYEPIAKFLLSSLADGSISSEAETSDTNKVSGTKESDISKNGDGKGSAKQALPVLPSRLTTEALESFCLSTTRKIGGQVPLCVVSLTPAFKLDSVHMFFRNEPLLFFEGHSDRDVLLTSLREKFGLTEIADALEGNSAHHVFLLRAPKRDTFRYRLLEGITTADALTASLHRVLEGDLPLEKKVLS